MCFIVGLSLVFVLPCNQAAAGQAQPQLSQRQLKTLLTTAKTASAEQKIAAYYRSEEKSLNAKAQEFSEQAALYASRPATIESKQGTSCLCGSHFRYFARLYEQQARESEASAVRHEKAAQAYLMKE
jgi:hypothetical protein